ncbi:MAG TPA: hypothetical protein VIM30_01730 [Candidatus Limnocylindrales bacterium]|jgi:hypothetical protein
MTLPAHATLGEIMTGEPVDLGSAGRCQKQRGVHGFAPGTESFNLSLLLGDFDETSAGCRMPGSGRADVGADQVSLVVEFVRYLVERGRLRSRLQRASAPAP